MGSIRRSYRDTDHETLGCNKGTYEANLTAILGDIDVNKATRYLTKHQVSMRQNGQSGTRKIDFSEAMWPEIITSLAKAARRYSLKTRYEIYNE